MDMENLIGETTEYDKKAALEVRKPKSWCKSVSAFANTLGGALIFGMADDGQIVGLTEPDSDAEKISEIIKTRMEPIPEFRLRFHRTEGGKVLLILDVFKGDETPYYYSGDGTMDALDDAEYSGSVLSLIENGEAFIKRNARMMWRKTPNSREELPEYVERSYHEALVNALAHRDYLVYGSEVHIDIYDDRLEIYSPGGMPDGSIIQDRDPLTVPSTRRNPVLADVFNRLGYMERKGSGFGKILNGYKVQVNYTENKRPMFRSDRYQFTVVMPNLNYGVPQGVSQDVPQCVPQDVPQDDLDAKILALIKKDNKISTEKLGMALGVSYKTIRRHIKAMGNVRYIGRGFSGHWEVENQ